MYKMLPFAKTIRPLHKLCRANLPTICTFGCMRVIIIIILCCTHLHAQEFDLQGHRGARGLLPENTIPAFIKAMDLGATTLEMDVVITKDRQVVVSHEAYFSSRICLDPSGQSISKSEEKAHNIYGLNYEEIAKYDCGSLGHSNYPEQENMRVTKPLLVDVIKAAERHAKGVTGFLIYYNIEIKSSPDGDNVYHPDVGTFSDLVHEVIDKYLDPQRVVIQSFDFRVLQYWHETYPDIQLAALVANTNGVNGNLKKLGFTPDIYSPYFKLVNKSMVDKLKAENIRLIPWTVNEKDDMKRMVALGVDGLITDYPNRAKEVGLTVAIPFSENK